MNDPVPNGSVTFGPWRYDGRVGRLLRDDGAGGWVPVAIGSRAGQILAVLLRDPGALVSKDALMDAVWPGVIVEANNLTVQIAALRRVLDDGVPGHSCVQTVAGRGYRFVRPVSMINQSNPLPGIATTETPPAAPSSFPPSLALPVTAIPPPASRGRPQVDRHAESSVSGPFPAIRIRAAVAVLSCVLMGGAVWMVTRSSPIAALAGLSVGRQQIAVLPLLTIGGGDEYFADGLTEDLIAALGRFPEIAVRGRGAVIAYKDHPGTPSEIGRALSVGYIVEGSVRRTPERLRVAVRLVGTGRSTVLWSETYEVEPKEVFAVQDDITRRVAGMLSARLNTLAVASAVSKAPGRLEAYDFVLRGRQRLDQVTRAGTSEARALFEQAIALDPGQAAAYIGLCRAGVQALEEGWTGDPEGTLARAIIYGQKAVAIQEDNSAAHAGLGRALLRAGNYETAFEELKRAMALNPSDPDAIGAYGEVLSLTGDSKSAIPFMEEAAQFRPDRQAGEYLALGIAYILSARPDDAVRILEQGQTRAPQLSWFSVLLAASYAQLGRSAEAEREAANVHRLLPNFDVTTFGSLMRRPEDRELLRAALQRAHL